MKNTHLPYMLKAVLLSVALPSLQAQVGTLVKDINAQSPPINASSDSMVKVTIAGTEVLIIATDDPLNGSEIWRSNGTLAGTTFIQDIVPGSANSAPINLTPVGSKVFFSAQNSSGDRDLWVTNGTAAGTTLVADLSYGSGEGPDQMIGFNNLLYFEGTSTAAGRELWRSDGTNAGTVLLEDIRPGSGSSGIGDQIVYSGNLFFTATDGAKGTELWKTDGTTVTLVSDISAGSGTAFPEGINPSFTEFNGKLYFTASALAAGAELWQTDGTEAGTTLYADVFEAGASSTPADYKVMTITGSEAGTYLYFSADNGTSADGRELWRTDGASIPTTVLLRDVRNGALSSNPSQLTVVGSQLYFTADDGNGVELHRVDGRTGNSTTRVADIVPGVNGSDPSNLLTFNTTTLLFTALDASGNLGLYSSTVGSSSVPRLVSFGVGSLVTDFVQIGSSVFFLVNGSELWTSNGTTIGTLMVKNFREGNAGSSPTSISVVGEVAYFSANDGISGSELWKTDGTATGTEQVADIVAGSASSNPGELTALGSEVYFSADDSSGFRQLLASDGTLVGTRSIQTKTGPNPGDIEDINPSGESDPRLLTAIGDQLYFSATNGNSSNGREPWVTDGTPAGTRMLLDIAPNSSNSDPSNFIEFASQVYFVARGSNGEELYRTSGATAELAVDLIPGGGSSVPDYLVTTGTGSSQRLYFSARTNASGRELWVSNGTVEGTTLVKDIIAGGQSSNPMSLTVVDKTIYFIADDGVNGAELWRSNGTDAGTVIARDIRTGSADSDPESLVESGLKLFFTADNGVNGRELWVADHNVISFVKDIAPGTASPGIQEMRDINGVLCFSANDGVNGRELWVSDGTESGTIMINDLTGISSSSTPANFTSFKSQLLYSAYDNVVNNELRIAFIGPDITVEQPVNVALVNGVSSVNFGVVTTNESVMLTFRIKNDGINSLTDVLPIITGVNAKEFSLVSPKAAKVVVKGGMSDFAVKFTPKEGGARTASLQIQSNDGDENPFRITLNGSGMKVLTFTTHPVSAMRYVGQAVSFNAAAVSTSMTPISLQWKKGSAVLKNATDAMFGLTSVTLKDAGDYILSAKAGKITALSNPGQLGVVQDNSPALIVAAPLSGRVTLKVAAAGTGLTYSWLRGATRLTNNARTSGATSASLTLAGLLVSDTAIYTCEVTGAGGTLVGGTTSLRVFSSAPILTTPQNMPDGIISGPYVHQIMTDPAAERTPTAYAASKLPPGLKVDTKTGLITGKPTKSGTFSPILTAKNSIATVTLPEEIVIGVFPTGVAGVYTGRIDREEDINQSLGGRFDLTVGSTGSYTGGVTLGATRTAIKGSLDIVGSLIDPDPPVSEVVIKRNGLDDLTVHFEIDRDNGVLQNSVVTDGTADAVITGWRQADALIAAQYLGYYTFGLQLGDPGQVGLETTIPQGWSYGSFTIAKDGKLNIAGRTADGEKITCATFVSPTGRVLFYQTLYTPGKGSLLGDLLIDPVDTDVADDNFLTGDVDWMRPADTSIKSRVYQDGFGLGGTPVPLEAIGSIFNGTLVTPFTLLGLVEGDSNASLDFEFGGIAASLPNDPDISLGITSANKIVPLSTGNETLTTLKPIVTKTGLFTGTFALTDPDLRTGFTKPLTRKVTFYGILIKDGMDGFGAGNFLLGGRPVDGETPTTVPVLSGKVELD